VLYKSDYYYYYYCAPCTYDYMLLIISLVCIIIFLSLLCQFVWHLSFT